MINNQPIHEKIDIIVKYIQQNYNFSEHNYSLFLGDSGVLLFFAYYYKYINNSKEYSEFISTGLEQVLVKIQNEITISNKIDYSFYNGLSGFYWLLQQLERLELIQVEDIIDKEMIAEIILPHCLNDLEYNQNFDFMSGAIGASYVFMNDLDFEIANVINNEILKIPITNENSCIWLQKVFNDEKKSLENGQNLGLAHGYSNILLFLVKIYNQKQSKAILIVIEKTVQQLIKLEFSDKQFSIFPGEIYSNGSSSRPTPLWWSYSDLGAGLAILKCSEVLKNPKFLEIALSIINRSIERTADSDVPILNAGICQGDSGIIQLLQSIKQNLTEFDLTTQQNYWFNNLLEKISISITNLHFDYQSKIFETKFDLFDGLSGIGLTLISEISSDYEWNKAFIIT